MSRQTLQIVSWIAPIVLVVAYFIPVYSFPTLCPFHSLTKLPCPFCGMTRCFHSLSHGHILQSLQYHPFFSLLALAGLILFVTNLRRLIVGHSTGIAESIANSRSFPFTIAAAFLLNWCYLLLFSGI